MRILLDLFHPAHFHLFRNAARILERRGHTVLWVAHDKDVLVQLLQRHGCAYTILSRARNHQMALAAELMKHDWGLYRVYRKFRPRLMMGTSLSICHIAKVTKGKAIVFFEDDVDIVQKYYRLGYALADAICTPDCVRHKVRKNHFTYAGYHELAYLHPNYFTRDAGIFHELDLKEGDPYFLIRLVALRAVHDVGQKGLSVEGCRRLIHVLAEHGRVFLNAEMELPPDLAPYRIKIPPERIHHALASATLFIGDSQTMTAEAAVLGTPAIRCNTFVGRISYLEELEHTYGLTYGFLPEHYDAMIGKAQDLLKRKDLAQEWQRRRHRMLSEKIDVSAWIARFVEDYMQSHGWARSAIEDSSEGTQRGSNRGQQ